MGFEDLFHNDSSDIQHHENKPFRASCFLILGLMMFQQTIKQPNRFQFNSIRGIDLSISFLNVVLVTHEIVIESNVFHPVLPCLPSLFGVPFTVCYTVYENDISVFDHFSCGPVASLGCAPWVQDILRAITLISEGDQNRLFWVSLEMYRFCICGGAVLGIF